MGAEIANQRTALVNAYDFGDKAVRGRDPIAYMPPCVRVPFIHWEHDFTAAMIRFVMADNRGTLAS